jgi:hypothetical protein
VFPSGSSVPLGNEVQNETFDFASKLFSQKMLHNWFDVLLFTRDMYEDSGLYYRATSL